MSGMPGLWRVREFVEMHVIAVVGFVLLVLISVASSALLCMAEAFDDTNKLPYVGGALVSLFSLAILFGPDGEVPASAALVFGCLLTIFGVYRSRAATGWSGQSLFIVLAGPLFTLIVALGYLIVLSALGW